MEVRYADQAVVPWDWVGFPVSEKGPEIAEEGGGVPKPKGWVGRLLRIPSIGDSWLGKDGAHLHEKASQGRAEQERRTVWWHVRVEGRIIEDAMEQPAHFRNEGAHLRRRKTGGWLALAWPSGPGRRQ